MRVTQRLATLPCGLQTACRAPAEHRYYSEHLETGLATENPQCRRDRRRYLTHRTSPARSRRRALDCQRPPRLPGEVLKLPSAALNCQRGANQSVPGRGRAEAGEWLAAERGGERTGRRRPGLARQSASPPRSAPRPRQVSWDAAGSRPAGRADGGDAHRLGVGAGGGLRSASAPAAPGAHGGSLAARRPVFSYKPQWQERRRWRRRLRNLPASRATSARRPAQLTPRAAGSRAPARRVRVRAGRSQGGAGRGRRTGTGRVPAGGGGAREERGLRAHARGCGRGACAREGAGHSPGPDLQRGRGGSRNSGWGRARKGQGRGPGLRAVRAPAFGCLWASVTELARPLAGLQIAFFFHSQPEP